MADLELNLCSNELKGHLISRDKSMIIREMAINKIKSASSDTVFYYDFSEVKAVTGSAIDELITKVMNYLIDNEKSKYLYLKNLREDEYEHEYNINSFLKNQSKIGIIAKNGDDIKFLGDISKSLFEILEIVYSKNQITARDISQHLDKPINLASTYLNKLHHNKLIMRKEEALLEGGRQFIYKTLF